MQNQTKRGSAEEELPDCVLLYLTGLPTRQGYHGGLLCYRQEDGAVSNERVGKYLSVVARRPQF
jgi:hypothetical protein